MERPAGEKMRREIEREKGRITEIKREERRERQQSAEERDGGRE